MNNVLKSVIDKYKNIPDFTGINISGVESRSVCNDQLLHVAVVNGDIDSVKKLLSEGALINDKGENYFTPLHYAVEQGHYDIVSLLISHDANKDIKNKFEETALDLANNLDEAEILKLLKK